MFLCDFRCKIFAARDRGISVAWHGRGVFIENEIRGNSRANVFVSMNSEPTFLRNKISDSAVNVCMFKDSAGCVRENAIFLSRYSSILAVGADPLICSNDIYNSGVYGIFITWSGKGFIQGNKVNNQSRVCEKW